MPCQKAQMKRSESSDLKQPWPPFVNQKLFLKINGLDFSDLWDEEDLNLEELDSSQSNLQPNQKPGCHLDTPPPPPAPPPSLPQSTLVSLDSGHKTLRLHWKELLSLQPLPRLSRFGQKSIWATLEPVHLDTNRLKYLFKSKSSKNKAFSAPLSATQNQRCVSVLSVKRSNIITIALSSLPPPHLLPPAIYSMDSSVLNREDVQKLQSLVPSEEELNLIKKAKAQAPQCPLASAEQCLLILGNVAHLRCRLQLWAFALDYDTLEKEIAEPLFHLKLAMEQLSANQTFQCILATVLAIGNFLNGCKARGFELSYLGKLSQVRDTHSRQPLLHHVCMLLLQLYPQSTDLYSDITAVTWASKCDYSQVQANLSALESLCTASWEQLDLLDKDSKKKKEVERKANKNEACLYQSLPQFLKECSERLKVLRAVHRRVINRFNSFLLYLGYSCSMVREMRADAFCKTVSDFSLEYRATRHAILQQREKEEKQEKEKEDNNGLNCSTPKVEAKELQSPSEDSTEQSNLEELLKTPESSFHFDTSFPRHRSKTPKARDSLPQRLKR